MSYLAIVNFPLLLSQILSQVQWISLLCSTFSHWHKPVWLWTDGHFILEILTQFSFWQTSPTYSYRRTWYNIMVTGSMLSLGNEKKTVKRMLYKWRQGKIQNSNPTSGCSQDSYCFYLKSNLGEIKKLTFIRYV